MNLLIITMNYIMITKNKIIKYSILLIILLVSIAIYYDFSTPTMGMKQWVELLLFEFALQAYYTQYISNNEK